MAKNACVALAEVENPGMVYAATVVVLAFALVISSFFLKKQEQMKIGTGNQTISKRGSHNTSPEIRTGAVN